MAPVMELAALALIACVGLRNDEIDQAIAAQIAGELPGCRFVDPHQGRVQYEPLLHSQIQDDLERLDGVVAAIRIPGIIGLAHSSDEVAQPSTVSQGGSKGQKYQVAARNKRVRQATLPNFDGYLACQRGVGNLPKGSEIDRVLIAQTLAPGAVEFCHGGPNLIATGKFDPVPLTVVEPDGFDPFEPIKRPSETRRGVLATGEQDERSLSGAHISSSPIAPK